jgi:integrase
MAFSGLRVSELAGLTWADIDLVDRVVRVDRQLAPLRRGEEPRRVRPKSQASVREVPLLDRVYEALLAQLREEQARGSGECLKLRLYVPHWTLAWTRPSL